MNKVDIDTAKQDFQRFLEALKVTPMKRTKLEEEEENVLKLIEEGYLLVNEDNSLSYNLIQPIEDDDSNEICNSLNFPVRRIRVEDLEKKMIGKTDIEKARKMIAFMTKQNSALLSKLDADDMKSCSDISSFFLPR